MKIRLEAVRLDRISAMWALNVLFHMELGPKEKQEFINSLPRDIYVPFLQDLPKIKEIFLTSEIQEERNSSYNFPRWNIYVNGEKDIPIYGDALDLANKIIELCNSGHSRSDIYVTSPGPMACPSC